MVSMLDTRLLVMPSASCVSTTPSRHTIVDLLRFLTSV